jgi:hypothetical protein
MQRYIKVCDQCGKEEEEQSFHFLPGWMEIKETSDGSPLGSRKDICSYLCMERYGKRMQRGKGVRDAH